MRVVLTHLTPLKERPLLCPSAAYGLPVPVQGASAHARFFDHAGPFGPCDGASETCCLPRSKQRRHPGIGFRGSMAGLCPPLPTLRRRPYGRQRTARGRCGSLLLHRSGLAPPTPCRSPGALRVLHAQPGRRSPAHCYLERSCKVIRAGGIFPRTGLDRTPIGSATRPITIFCAEAKDCARCRDNLNRSELS